MVYIILFSILIILILSIVFFENFQKMLSTDVVASDDTNLHPPLKDDLKSILTQSGHLTVASVGEIVLLTPQDILTAIVCWADNPTYHPCNPHTDTFSYIILNDQLRISFDVAYIRDLRYTITFKD